MSEDSNGRRAVVTGGAGFIGSHLVARLLGDGYEVWIVDNFATGRESNIDAAIREGPPNGQTKLFRVDIAGDDDLRPIVDGATYVFHLAALADIVPSVDNPSVYHRTNVDGTVRLLEAMRATGGTTKLVYAASSSCYGLPDIVPTPESAELRPQYPYALTKCVAEQYVMHWSQLYNLPAVSLRFFNVYGPRARTDGTYGAVFGVFLAQKLAGQPFTVVGDGEQTRDFVYVTDVVDACVKAAESDVTGTILNVGASDPRSINELCDLIGGPRVYVPKRPGEPDCTSADTSRIRSLLGWKPTVRFEEGTAKMMESISVWRDAPVWTPETIHDATTGWFKYLDKKVPQHA